MVNEDKLRNEINALLDYLEKLDPSDSKYIDTVNAIEKLNRLSGDPNTNKQKWYENPEIIKTGIVVFGEFACIAMTLHWEELHVLTSRALSHLVRPRI